MPLTLFKQINKIGIIYKLQEALRQMTARNKQTKKTSRNKNVEQPILKTLQTYLAVNGKKERGSELKTS